MADWAPYCLQLSGRLLTAWAEWMAGWAPWARLSSSAYRGGRQSGRLTGPPPTSSLVLFPSLLSPGEVSVIATASLPRVWNSIPPVPDSFVPVKKLS